MDEPKVAVLRHYASPYYDPQKAHEYYMRTRELKGRSTTSLNDEGKKIWSYTKNNINIFAYTAEYGSTNLQFKIENRIVYEGV